MKRIFTLLTVLAIGFTSCEKEETIQKDYNAYIVSFNLNSTDGKLVDEIGPDWQPTGQQIPQYFYSVQYFYNLDDADGFSAYVNSQTDYTNFVIPKDPNSTLVENSTASGDWDVAFTQYVTEDSYVDTETNETVYQEYDVVGALVNSASGVTVAKINDANFETLTLEDAQGATFLSDVDVIGWDWKVLNFSTFTYEMVADTYFLIKLTNNDIYKLRFTDFYGKNPDTDDLEKGHISFEFQLLK